MDCQVLLWRKKGAKYIESMYFVNADSFGDAEHIAIENIAKHNHNSVIKKMESVNIASIDSGPFKHHYKLIIEAAGINPSKPKTRYHQFHLVSGDDLNGAVKRAEIIFKKKYGSKTKILVSTVLPIINILNYN